MKEGQFFSWRLILICHQTRCGSLVGLKKPKNTPVFVSFAPKERNVTLRSAVLPPKNEKTTAFPFFLLSGSGKILVCVVHSFHF